MSPFGMKAEPLEGKRCAIYETIRQTPGINFLGVVQAHDLAYGEAAHHLRMLEHARLIFSAKVGRYRRYWATLKGYGPSTQSRFEACPVRGPVLQAIRARPGLLLTALAAVFSERTRQATAYHVRQLAQEGLVRVERRGATHALFAAVQTPVPTIVSAPATELAA